MGHEMCGEVSTRAGLDKFIADFEASSLDRRSAGSELLRCERTGRARHSLGASSANHLWERRAHTTPPGKGAPTSSIISALPPSWELLRSAGTMYSWWLSPR